MKEEWSLALKNNFMSKRTLSLFFLFDLAVVSFIFLYFFYESEEDRIKRQIEAANYCEVVSDCQQVAVSKCPFGCYIYVNKDEGGRIEELLSGFQSNCEYGCIEMKGVDCVNNTCEVIH